MILDRYQSSATEPGTMPTGEWFAALLRGIDGPLGTVLDVGSAEGVMSLLAVEHGADRVLGIGLHDDRMQTAKEAGRDIPNVDFREMEARDFSGSFRTVIYSMMAHWLGRGETRRFARMATRNFAVIFRTQNDHYAIPANGTWFPALAEMDETIGGVRTHEELLLTQDWGKEVWAATYRTDLSIVGKSVFKDGIGTELYEGRDLHGDQPFRPTIGAPLAVLTESEQEKVYDLVRVTAKLSLKYKEYPTDFSPRNIIVGERANIIDPDMAPYTGRVDPEYLPIWQATLSTIGITDFDGDLRSLL